MLKANSIAYSIMISIVVGVFCYCFIAMSGYSRMHQERLFTHNELVSENASAMHYFLGKVETLRSTDAGNVLDNKGVQSKGEIFPWGFYDVLITESVFKKDTITRAALVGAKQQEQSLGLYLPDANKALFMVGDAKIVGTAYLPKRGIKQGYISSNSYRTSTLLEGVTHHSNSILPALRSFPLAYELANTKKVYMEELADTLAIYNTFRDPTLVIETNSNELSGKNYSGNIALKAKDSIFIRKNTKDKKQ